MCITWVLFPVRMQLGLCFTLLFFHWILFFGLLLVVLFFSCHFNMIFTCLLGCILATHVPSLLGSFISDLEVVFSKLAVSTWISQAPFAISSLHFSLLFLASVVVFIQVRIVLILFAFC